MDAILRKSLIAAVLTAAAIVILFLFVDRYVADAAFTLKHTPWHSIANQVSQAANHLLINVVVATGLVYAACDGLANGLTQRSRHVLYFCLTVMAAMLVGDVFKEFCGRARPPLLFDKGVYGFFPMAGDYLHFSFPSGHTLRIFSSMVALGYIFPRLRYPALLLAVIVGCSRVIALKHYPSDVLFGAFIGTTAAVWGWHLFHCAEHKS